MSSTLRTLISQTLLASKPCTKLLEFDGISSNRLVLRDQSGKLLLSVKNVPSLKNKIEGLGNSFTIIKNFDEYQFLLCSYVPALSDQSIFKFKFQKVRLLIFLFINRLTNMLVTHESMGSNTLLTLNKSGNSILLETSDLIQQFRENNSPKSYELNIKKDFSKQIDLKIDHFLTFNIEEKEVNRILFSLYGYNLEEEEVGNLVSDFDEGDKD